MSVLQPCNQGIIRVLKTYYRTMMRRNVLRIIDAGLKNPSILLCANDVAEKISVLEALYLLSKSWKNVGEGTMQNCFRHGGFTKTDVEKNSSSPGKPHDLCEEEYADWINIDTNLEVACKPNEEDIYAELIRANVDDPAGSDSDDEGEDESDDGSPLNKGIIDVVAVLRKALQHRTGGAFFHTRYSYEREIMKLVEDGKKQTTLN